MIPKKWLEEAKIRIAPYIKQTPLTYDPKHELYLKWENHQTTHSFKDRGALNKILALQSWERERGLVAASAGNHGQGVAYAGKIVKAKVTIFVSERAVETKVEAMRALGAEVIQVPGGYHEVEQAGIAYAKNQSATWVSPYNDAQVIAGQASMAFEILDEMPELISSTWVVPVSGGGLISGIGAAIKEGSTPSLPSKERILIGVQSKASPFMHALYTTGSQDNYAEEDSLADGLAGPVEEGSITIPLTKKYVDDIILVSEKEILEGIRFAWNEYNEVIEGSAAVGLAAIISGKIKTSPAVVIISGGNIQPEIHQRIIKNA